MCIRDSCNPNALENLDHLSTNVSEQDDRSKLAIEGKIGFYWNLRYESCVFNCDNFLKQWSKQSSETGKDIVRKQTFFFSDPYISYFIHFQLALHWFFYLLLRQPLCI